MTLRSVVALAALFAASTAAPAVAQGPFDEKGMYNLGVHAGRSMWAVRRCNAKPTDNLELLGRMGQKLHPRSFERGFAAGMADAQKGEKNNPIEIACLSANMLYGKNGINAADFIEWNVERFKARAQP